MVCSVLLIRHVISDSQLHHRLGMWNQAQKVRDFEQVEQKDCVVRMAAAARATATAATVAQAYQDSHTATTSTQ